MNPLKLHGALIAALWLGVMATAQASGQLAVDYGCVNCHGATPRGEAPSFEDLSGRLAKYKGDETALIDKVSRYRAGKAFEHVDAHERISAEAATALLRWLAEGGK